MEKSAMFKRDTLVAETAQVISTEKKWVDRIAMIRKAIQEGIPLNQIEQRLDWLDHLSENIPKAIVDAIPYTAKCVRRASQREEGHGAIEK